MNEKYYVEVQIPDMIVTDQGTTLPATNGQTRWSVLGNGTTDRTAADIVYEHLLAQGAKPRIIEFSSQVVRSFDDAPLPVELPRAQVTTTGRILVPSLEEIKAHAAQLPSPTVGGTPLAPLPEHEQAVVDTFGGGAAPEIPGDAPAAELKLTTADAAQLHDALDDTDGKVLPGLQKLLDTPAPWDTPDATKALPVVRSDIPSPAPADPQPGDPGFVDWYQARVNRHDPSTGVRTSTRASQGI